MDTLTDILMVSQTDKQNDRQTDGKKDKKTVRQIYKKPDG
jgi:hypothetical protein